MPYFLYRIDGPKQLQPLDRCDGYKEARDKVRQWRSSMEPGNQAQIRMMFARNEAEAEKLLSAPREQRLIDEG